MATYQGVQWVSGYHSRVLPLKQAAEALALACAKSGVVKVQIDLT